MRDPRPDQVLNAVLHSYESAVVQAAQKRDPSANTFANALASIDKTTFESLRDSYTAQVEALTNPPKDS